MADIADRLSKLSPAQRALLEKRLAAKAKSRSPDGNAVEPIAIVGMACRFAGATDVDAYWRLIAEGLEGVTDVPADRWPVDAFYDPNAAPGKTITRRGGFLGNIDQFDPTFFGVTPREAARMDPQQRLLLEVAWEAMESGGSPPDQMAGSNTGVYVGIGGTDYAKVPTHEPDYYERIDAHMGVGNALSIAANRVSYVLDLRGPSLSVDTACSSSSLAIHLAAESIRRGECDAALAGGVNAIITPETTIAFSKAQMLSPEGRCRPFDAGANGYVRGEGCGLVMLKRLSDAQRDGDRVLALLRGTAVNQDGRTSGISAPNGERQKACIRTALAEAKLTPQDVDYIEAHGTSTPLGDPIEMQALTEVFRKESPSDLPVRVTSVKANIGHTETVSGIAGLIKVILLMKHGVVPPQLHFEKLNPHISLDGSRINIPCETGSWEKCDRVRVAGISSFGFGGTNTHLVVSEAPQLSNNESRVIPDHGACTQLIKLSTKTETALPELAKRLATHLRENEDLALADIAFTTNTGRCDFNHRTAIIADDTAQLLERLDKVAESAKGPGIYSGKASGLVRPKAAWLFTGQGAQRPGMGRDLYQSQPVFRSAIDRVAASLEGVLEAPLLDVLYPQEASDERIHETRYTQPALFAVEYALAQLWQSWGMTPDVLLGHSIGEYAAAVVAGVLGVQDAALLVAERARLMHSAPGHGKMAVLFIPEAQVREAIAGQEDQLSIAAVNGPTLTVLSGEASAVDALYDKLEAEGVKGSRLTVSHAFHSPLMDPVLEEFERFAERFDYAPPKVPIASNVTGQLITATSDQQFSARYWRDHLRGTVRFADGVATVAAAGIKLWIETGPAPVLLGMARRCDPTVVDADKAKITPLWIPSIREGKSEDLTIAEGVAACYTAGGRIDWRQGNSQKHQRIDLPTYPFQRSRCWYENLTGETSGGGVGIAGATNDGSPVLGVRLPVVGTTVIHEVGLSSDSPACLADHCVQGSVVAPGAMYIEQALSALALSTAASREEGFQPLQVNNVSIDQVLFLSEGKRRRIQTTLAPESAGHRTVEIHSLAADVEADTTWASHASAQLVLGGTGEFPSPMDLAACRERAVDTTSHDDFYREIAKRGLEYGPAFRVLGGVERSAYDAVATVEPIDSVRNELGRYQLHPVIGDALMQTIACTTPLEADGSYSPHTYVPVRVESVRLYEPVPTDEPLFAYAVRRSPAPDSDETSPETIVSDAFLTHADGRPIAALLGVRVQRLGAGTTAAEVDPAEWLYQIEWRKTPLAVNDTVPGGTWLLFADTTGVADSLAERIEVAGGSCVMVRPGEAFGLTVNESSGKARTEVTIDPADSEHHTKLLQVVTSNPTDALAAVVHLWSLDGVELSTNKDADAVWKEAQRTGVGSVMRLLQQAGRRALTSTAGTVLVTRNAQAVASKEAISPPQAAVIGLGRVAAMEHPELRIRMVDLDQNTNVDALMEELIAAAAGDTENQIALHDGERRVGRLSADLDSRSAVAAEAGHMTVPTGRSHQLRIPRPGSFESLRYEPFDRVTPGPGEVEFKIHATGLNFSDVLKALGLYPGLGDGIVPLGIEASGVVTAIGEGVDRFAPGDKVFGVAPYAFASHTASFDYTLVHKPANLTDEEACTIPITFMTAYHALVRLGGLAKGERVLIHAGAGGVGLAAIQIAQHMGAEIFATAGSEEKRELLRELGVPHVMNSRTLDFVEEVRQATGREGIDVVLNSLPGEAISASLSLLKAYGRFLEIGKIDIYQDRKIGLLPFQDNLSYHAIDLDRVMRERPEYVQGLFAEVMEHFENGDYQPLRLTQFDSEETAAAFRYMSQRKNIGKVVVTKGEDGKGKTEDSTSDSIIHSDAGYLITGGLGALGRRVAEWLVQQGAGGVALLSRRQPAADIEQELDTLRQSGTQVVCLQGDVTDAASLRTALQSLPADFPQLRGVIHAAGVLDDGLLIDLTAERLDRVLQPKTTGAWNLHTATLDKDLPFASEGEGGVDLFVLFSSVAAVLGSPGQANYAAANAALDALAHLRRFQGLAATSINWGPFSSEGMASGGGMAAGDNEDAVRQKGMELLDADKALELMGKLTGNVTQTTVMAARWDAMSRLLAGRQFPLLEDLLVEGDDAASGAVDTALRSRLVAADPAERRKELQQIVCEDLARVMSVEPEQIDIEQPLSALGLDSLMALELKNQLEAKLAFTLPMAKLLEGPSVVKLAEAVAEVLVGDAPASSGPAKWTPLLTLREGEADREPLFLAPALGGDVRCYQEMIALLTTDRPIIAFRPRGLDEDALPHDAMGPMVEDYVTAIRERQLEGPYHLAGWSTGGVTAYALADQLEATGGEVAMLALFDPPSPESFRGVDTEDDAKFLAATVNFAGGFTGLDFTIDVEELDRLPPEERFPRALEEAKRAGMFNDQVDAAYVHRLVVVGEGLVRAARDYEPRPLRGGVHFFVPDMSGALDPHAIAQRPSIEVWKEGVGRPMTFHPSPGNHFTMMNNEGAEAIARVLNELL